MQVHSVRLARSHRFPCSRAARVLPRLQRWLRQKRAERATAGSAHQQLIVEWTAAAHRFHEVRFLYATR